MTTKINAILIIVSGQHMFIARPNPERMTEITAQIRPAQTYPT
jgi:hypothetical protein